MRNAINSAVLVLNSSFEAISIRSARRALTLVVKDRAVIQEHTGQEIYPGIYMPSVIRLKEYRYIPVRIQILSRKNIFLRDRNICQYCEKHFSASELTLDHIVPKSKGGRDSWDNLCACCQKCNKKKADKSLEESGMKLLHKPRPASIHTSRFILKSMGEEDEKWKPYLYFNSTGEQRFQHTGN
jgi:5-methylcytosine-specific restriction endonuclease McrA